MIKGYCSRLVVFFPIEAKHKQCVSVGIKARESFWFAPLWKGQAHVQLQMSPSPRRWQRRQPPVPVCLGARCGLEGEPGSLEQPQDGHTRWETLQIFRILPQTANLSTHSRTG